MTVNATELVTKLNLVVTTRSMKEKELIEDYPDFPATLLQEEELIRNLMFAYLKKKFVGCKIRANANSFSVRLDGQIHRKANKIRQIFNHETEWKQWFSSHHSNLHRTMRDNRRSFPNERDFIQRREVEDKVFLYVPHRPSRIYGYVDNGLMHIFSWIDSEFKKDERLFEIYDEVTQLMAQEVERREVERRERIERELREYKQKINRALFKPATALQESEDAVDRLFAQKFLNWARENNVAPEYTVDYTAEHMVPTDLKVKIMAPPGSEEEGWVALPPFEGYPELESYEMQGWGKVTSIDMTSDRSRQGQSPIVVQEYLYTEFRPEHWEHLLPENYSELLEASKSLRAEAEREVAPWLEQERIRKEQEEVRRQAQLEEERRLAEEERLRYEEELRLEAERAAQAQEEERQRTEAQRQQEAQAEAEMARRRQSMVESLRAQVTEREVPQPAVQPNPFGGYDEAIEGEAPEVRPEPARATNTGLYRNTRAIPLERYVAISTDGTTRRFRSAEQAYRFLEYTGLHSVFNYHEPHERVDVVQFSESIQDADEPDSSPF